MKYGHSQADNLSDKLREHVSDMNQGFEATDELTGLY
jgi:hypothetical protein